ncbi:MAG: polyprenyl synthetase family protein [Flavobacteriales bacterium]|nr:polyprenyl synthetase family protein [Flavobacteriales bacterium]
MSNSLMKSMLAEYGAATLEGINKYIPDKEPRKYLYDLVADYPNRGGKGFRPGLCIAACKAYGGKQSDAMDSAICLELLHNAFLVHDDIEDESFFRRNKPTLHEANNSAIAINVGDAMQVLSLSPLYRNREILGDRVATKVYLEVQRMILESVEGQAMELGWRKDNMCDLKEADYLRMILKKTCWYTCMQPLRIGAIIGTRGQIDPDTFDRLGYFMGTSFQIQDDILNLVGEEDKYGKEVCGDIIEGKRTLMLIHLLGNCKPAEFRDVRSFLANPIKDRSIEDARSILELMHQYDSIEQAKKTAQYLAGGALKEFYSIFSKCHETQDKALIENIILYMINREY